MLITCKGQRVRWCNQTTAAVAVKNDYVLAQQRTIERGFSSYHKHGTKKKILSPHEELNPRPSDALHWATDTQWWRRPTTKFIYDMQKVHIWHWKIIYLQYFVLYSLLKAWCLVMSFHSPFFLSMFFILFIVSLDASKFFMNVFFSSFLVFYTVLQRFCLVNSCH